MQPNAFVESVRCATHPEFVIKTHCGITMQKHAKPLKNHDYTQKMLLKNSFRSIQLIWYDIRLVINQKISENYKKSWRSYLQNVCGVESSFALVPPPTKLISTPEGEKLNSRALSIRSIYETR